MNKDIEQIIEELERQTLWRKAYEEGIQAERNRVNQLIIEIGEEVMHRNRVLRLLKDEK